MTGPLVQETANQINQTFYDIGGSLDNPSLLT